MLKRVILGLTDILSVSPDVFIVLFMSWAFGANTVVEFMVVDSFLGISHSITSCLASSSFLNDKDNSPKGMGLVFYIGLVVSIVSLITCNYLVAVLALVTSSNAILHYIKIRILYDGKSFNIYGIVYGIAQSISYVIAFVVGDRNTIILYLYIAYLFTRVVCLLLTIFYYKYNMPKMFKLNCFASKWLRNQIIDFVIALKNTNEMIILNLFKMIVTKSLSVSLVTKSTSELIMLCGKVYSLFYNVRELLNKERLFRIVESGERDMDINDSRGQAKALLLFSVINSVSILFCCLFKGANISMTVFILVIYTGYYFSNINNAYFMEVVLRKNGLGIHVAIIYVIESIIQMAGIGSGSDYVYLSTLIVGAIFHYTAVFIVYRILAVVKKFNPVYYTPSEFYRGKE